MKRSDIENAGWQISDPFKNLPRLNGHEYVLLTRAENPEDLYLASLDGQGEYAVLAYINGRTVNGYPCAQLPEPGEPTPEEAGATLLIRIVGALSDETGQLTILQSSGVYRRFSRWDRMSKGTPIHPNAIVRTLPQCGCGGYLGAPSMFDSMAEMTAYFYVVFSDVEALDAAAECSVTPGMSVCSVSN